MTITVDDLKFLASQRMNDDPDGGGFPTGTAVQDGVENNVFPDIGTLDRANGRLQLRKIYAACLSLSQDTYIGAHVVIDDDPDDANVDAIMFQYGNLLTERADVAPALVGSSQPDDAVTIGATANSTTWTIAGSGSPVSLYPVGTLVYTNQDPVPQQILTITQDNFGNRTLTVERGSSTAPTTMYLVRESDTTLSLKGVARLALAANPGDTKVKVNKTTVHLVTQAVDTATFKLFRAKDVLVISETTSSTSNVSPGTINSGFTNLSRVRIIGANGTIIGRYDFGAAQPSGTGASVDFAAGTINVTSTAGWAQPVTIESRIEDLRVCKSVSAGGLNEINLNKALTHAFTTNAKVSSAIVYGDLQGKVHQGFSQTSFTGAWSDDVIGSSPLADYNDALVPVQINNRGSVTERWMCLFTNSTTFNVVGEQVGVVSLGNLITQDCAPINPATLAPYFTIKKEGWGNGWGGGNLYRFNTDGANFPFWLGRNVAPSDPVPGQDSISIQLRGDIDA